MSYVTSRRVQELLETFYFFDKKNVVLNGEQEKEFINHVRVG